eukprot:4369329-Heterocapsa_arctica.AAC.1
MNPTISLRFQTALKEVTIITCRFLKIQGVGAARACPSLMPEAPPPASATSAAGRAREPEEEPPSAGGARAEP